MSNQDHLTEELGRELHRRVDALYDAPLTLDDVRGRARGIRRRRRVAATASIAAAVAIAVVVPTLLLGGIGSNRSDAPQPAPQPTPARGASVLHDGEVTLPGGATVSVDVANADVSQFGVLTDGRIVVANQAEQSVQVLAPDGSLQATYPVDLLLVTMSSTDELAAWIEGSRVQVLESGSTEPVALAHMPKSAGTIPMVDAVTGDHCADGGCRAILSDGTTTTAEVSVDGLRELATSEPLRVTDVSPDGDTWAVAFPPPQGEQYPCVGLYDPADDKVTARSCTAGGLEFSPDGRHLLSGRYENNMAGEVMVLDRALEVVRKVNPAPQVVSRAAWGDTTHVLAVLAGVDDNQWTLVRYPLDGGEPETVAGPVRGGNPEMMSEYLPSE